MAYKKRSERKSGGKLGNQYNAQGSPEEKEEHEKDEGFKRGGKARAHGGHVDGEKAMHHMGHRKRGMEHHAHGGKVGHHNHAGKGGHRAVHHGHGLSRGGAPFSSAHSLTAPSKSGKETGPGEQAASE